MTRRESLIAMTEEPPFGLGQCTVPVRAEDWPVGMRRVFEAWCVLVQNADKYPLMQGEPVEWVDELKSVKASKDYSTAIGTVDAQLLSVDPGGLLWVQVYYKHRWGRLEVVADGP